MIAVLILLGLVCYLLLGMTWARVVEKYFPLAKPLDLLLWPVSALVHAGALTFWLAVGKARDEKEKAQRAARDAWFKAELEALKPKPATCMSVEVTRNEQ